MTGLKWFRIDVMFEDKFELVCAEYGSTAFEVIVRLWQKIYAAGYYLEWNDEVALLFAKRHSLGGNAVSEIVKCAVRRGLFDKGMFDKYGILTSHGIQEWYFDSVERRKSVEVVKDYLLTDVTQKLQNADIIWKNVSKNGKNEDISQYITNSTNKTAQDSKESKKEIYKNPTTNVGADARETYDELMDRWEVSRQSPLRAALGQFIRHCALNRQVLTNDRLEDIIDRLYDYYGMSDEKGMCDSLTRAINGGYFDIREGRK